MRVVPKPNHFKRILRKKTNEESRLKGENKVECKKWTAKGTYRKASADREPTTHVNTLGGQRPRADSWRERAFRRARCFVFVGLWVCGFVGLWGCGVCVCVFYWPRGSQKAPKICLNRTKIEPKWTTNGTNLGQGEGKGQPKIDKNMKNYKKRKSKEAK